MAAPAPQDVFRSASLSFLLSLPFEPFFKPSAMQSRAAVLPLLVGLVLLCSAKTAQVSVLFFFRLKSRRRRNCSSHCRVARSHMTSLPRLWRKRAGLSLSDLAETQIIHGDCRTFERTASLGGALRARWFLRDGQQIEAAIKCVLLCPLFAATAPTARRLECYFL